jgi:hypothetical protein
MTPRARVFWAGLGAASILFHLGLIFSGLMPNLVSRPLHMARPFSACPPVCGSPSTMTG